MTKPYDGKWQAIRQEALKRDEHRCQFCTRTENLHVHHIRPRAMGGPDELWNLIVLCKDCHVESHRNIREVGLATIPNENYEPYRFQLTNREDVMRYINQLEEAGIDGSYLAEVEEER